MTLASFYSCTGWFESYLVKNPEDRFSHDEAHMSVENKHHRFVIINLLNTCQEDQKDELLQQPQRA